LNLEWSTIEFISAVLFYTLKRANGLLFNEWVECEADVFSLEILVWILFWLLILDFEFSKLTLENALIFELALENVGIRGSSSSENNNIMLLSFKGEPIF
jgi:hypothetical protein